MGGPSCPLQTILLRDPVGCDSSLQIVMAGCRTFLNKARQTAIIISSGLSHLTQEVQILINVRQTASTICSGLSHQIGWAALPSENISQRLFVKNKKGLKFYIFLCLRPFFRPVCNTEPWLQLCSVPSYLLTQAECYPPFYPVFLLSL